MIPHFLPCKSPDPASSLPSLSSDPDLLARSNRLSEFSTPSQLSASDLRRSYSLRVDEERPFTALGSRSSSLSSFSSGSLHASDFAGSLQARAKKAFPKKQLQVQLVGDERLHLSSSRSVDSMQDALSETSSNLTLSQRYGSLPCLSSVARKRKPHYVLECTQSLANLVSKWDSLRNEVASTSSCSFAFYLRGFLIK